MYKIVLIIMSFWMISESVCAETIEKSTKVINGTGVSSSNDDWRFIVSLKWNGQHYCGGSLVSSKWIVTAAHCLSDSSGNPYVAESGDTVGVGNYNVTQTTNYSVKRFIVHPQYNSTTFDNDIGLIELNNEVRSIAPIVYDTSDTFTTGTQTKIAGWGTMHEGSYDPSDSLMEALTPLVDYNRCNASYDGALTNNMICAGYFTSTRDSCQGDSGGPLMIDGKLVGIVSWGIGCARDDYPGVYTKVKNYIKWIKSYVPKDSLFAPIILDDIITFIPYKR